VPSTSEWNESEGPDGRAEGEGHGVGGGEDDGKEASEESRMLTQCNQ